MIFVEELNVMIDGGVFKSKTDVDEQQGGQRQDMLQI